MFDGISNYICSLRNFAKFAKRDTVGILIKIVD